MTSKNFVTEPKIAFIALLEKYVVKTKEVGTANRFACKASLNIINDPINKPGKFTKVYTNNKNGNTEFFHFKIIKQKHKGFKTVLLK